MPVCKIDLPVDEMGRRTMLVKAEIVDVAPHLANVSTWAVHKHPHSVLGWRLTNVETGQHVGAVESRTRAECLQAATRYLSMVSVQKTVAALKRGATRTVQA